MSKENVQLVRAMFDAFLRGDAEALVAFADDDVELQPSGDLTDRMPERGHDAFLRFWRDWPSSWDDYVVEVREVHDAGDQVVVVLYERGRGPASGVVVDDVFAHVWTVDAGKVTRVQVFSDSRDALAAAERGDRPWA
jgi:ketosteroid isomerase-like protein